MSDNCTCCERAFRSASIPYKKSKYRLQTEFLVLLYNYN